MFTSESLAEAVHVKNVLEQTGITCLIKNEQLSGALGEIPFLECLPEVWILDDTKLTQAEHLVAEHTAPAAPAVAWECSACQQSNEGQFAACWNCGAAHGAS